MAPTTKRAVQQSKKAKAAAASPASSPALSSSSSSSSSSPSMHYSSQKTTTKTTKKSTSSSSPLATKNKTPLKKKQTQLKRLNTPKTTTKTTKSSPKTSTIVEVEKMSEEGEGSKGRRRGIGKEGQIMLSASGGSSSSSSGASSRGGAKFKPIAFFKDGELIELELDGKKGKHIRKALKQAKGNTTVYRNEESALKIVPFFRIGSVFSNFYPVTFRVANREFCCNEQFFHFCKALAFGDLGIAEKIMQTTNPKSHKTLGRQVRDFDSTRWEPISVLAMTIGLTQKFQQNELLRLELISTDGAELIEASPFDARWGAGKGAKQILAGDAWTGKNFLGRSLMTVRSQFLRPTADNDEGEDEGKNKTKSSPLPPPPSLPPLPSTSPLLSARAITELATEEELRLAGSLLRQFGISK